MTPELHLQWFYNREGSGKSSNVLVVVSLQGLPELVD